MAGPWQPVNETGLVAANPASEPTQAYSWWVTGERRVVGFIDYWGLAGRDLTSHPELMRTQFGGTPAPSFGLQFNGHHVEITA